ncbi:MAG TPA: hypothetical protein VFC31_09880 [Candidatus Limnocylindria bacterium]|nr:hypothetical protein [Candidatus Limnocylindria bacterium]
MLRIDPVAELQSGCGEIGKRLVVAQDVPTLDSYPPVPAVAGVVLDRLIEQRAIAPNVGHADGDPRGLPLGWPIIESDLGVVALDEHDPIRRDVSSTRGEKREPAGLIRSVDERAHEEYGAECASEIEVLDSRQNGLGAFDLVEHAFVEVDRCNTMAESDERVGDPARSAPEVKDRRTFRGLAVDEFGFAGGLEESIEVKRRSWIAHRRIVRRRPAAPVAISTTQLWARGAAGR